MLISYWGLMQSILVYLVLTFVNTLLDCSTLFKIPFLYVLLIQCRPQPLHTLKYWSQISNCYCWKHATTCEYLSHRSRYYSLVDHLSSMNAVKSKKKNQALAHTHVNKSTHISNCSFKVNFHLRMPKIKSNSKHLAFLW